MDDSALAVAADGGEADDLDAVLEEDEGGQLPREARGADLELFRQLLVVREVDLGEPQPLSGVLQASGRPDRLEVDAVLGEVRVKLDQEHVLVLVGLRLRLLLLLESLPAAENDALQLRDSPSELVPGERPDSARPVVRGLRAQEPKDCKLLKGNYKFMP